MMMDSRLTIVADENMPGVEEWFSTYGAVRLLPGRQIGPEHVADADVLLVRSVTQVNEALLADSSVTLVGSATIGVDHVDQDYLANRGIRFAHAPGCNAQAVVEYVLSCLAVLKPDWRSATVGVIGCGNVGGRLLKTLRTVGVDAYGYDPLISGKQPSGKSSSETMPLVSLEQVLACDVISMHTPLTRTGEFPTWHMLDQPQLSAIKPGTLLINAGRGAAINGTALLDCLKQQRFRCVLDVWEEEPDIDLELLQQVALATPHIAGYSLDGKVNGSLMVFQQFLDWLAKPAQTPQLGVLAEQREISADSINQAILQGYDVRQDDAAFRATIAERVESVAHVFDQFRKTYPHRLEFSHCRLTGETASCSDDNAVLKQLGFTF